MKPRILLSVKQNGQIYADAIAACGAEPVAFYLPEVDAGYDGLLLCGGDDIDPSYYGQENEACGEIDLERDRVEMALIQAYLEAGKPVMGICRGLQVLNVYFGGTLYQHMEQTPLHRQSKEVYCVHPVEAVEGSVLHKLYGPSLTVNSYHHQAIKTLGQGLKPVGYAGAVIEAVEHASLPVIAVQWHPEKLSFSWRRQDADDGAAILNYFVELCRKQ